MIIWRNLNALGGLIQLHYFRQKIYSKQLNRLFQTVPILSVWLYQKGRSLSTCYRLRNESPGDEEDIKSRTANEDVCGSMSFSSKPGAGIGFIQFDLLNTNLLFSHHAWMMSSYNFREHGSYDQLQGGYEKKGLLMLTIHYVYRHTQFVIGMYKYMVYVFIFTIYEREQSLS